MELSNASYLEERSPDACDNEVLDETGPEAKYVAEDFKQQYLVYIVYIAATLDLLDAHQPKDSKDGNEANQRLGQREQDPPTVI